MVDTHYKGIMEHANLLQQDQERQKQTLDEIAQQITVLTLNLQTLIKGKEKEQEVVFGVTFNSTLLGGSGGGGTLDLGGLQLSYFLSGLKDEIRLPVRMFNPPNLITAYGLAKIQEEHLLLNKKV